MARPKAMSNPAQVGQTSTAPRAAQRLRAPTLQRRTFNCIVDETVLIAGVKTNLLKKWVTRGDVRLFVPLSTLERLQALRHEQDLRTNADARLAMKWLDEVTNQTNTATGSRVLIEGSLEKYETWSEVKALMLPKDLVSVESNEPLDETDDEILTKNISDLLVDDEPDVDFLQSSTPERAAEPASPVSTLTKYSPSLLGSSPCFEPQQKVLAPIGSGRPLHRKTDSNASSILTTSTARPASRHVEDEDDVPMDLKPFFNHILWRIKKDLTTDMGVDSYILLTNDLAKQAVAQRFGIRVKRLDQMRETVMREDQDLKNRIAMQKREASQSMAVHKPPTLGFAGGSPVIPDALTSPTLEDSPSTPTATPARTRDPEDAEEDVILIKPKTPTNPKVPHAVQPQKGPKNGRPVFDPNSFARGPPVTGNGSVRGNNRGRGNPYGSVRGANTANGSTGNRYERPPSRGIYTVRRGQQSPQQSQGQGRGEDQQQPLDLSRPIDPNVFSRGGPAGVREKVRRQLWEP